METFRFHYWSLFADFINIFNTLSYHGIPLPLLSRFSHYVHFNDSVKKVMSEPSFEKYLRTKIANENLIQPHFDRYIYPLMGRSFRRNDSNGSGIIVLDRISNVLRLTQKSLLPHMNAYRMEWLNGKLLAGYQKEVDNISQSFIERARNIFLQFSEHPVFSNPLFQNKFYQDIPEMIHSIETIAQFFQRNLVSCVILGTTENMKARILALIAGSKGIPSICLQHSILLSEAAYLPVFATIHALYGQYEKEWYLSRGASSERLVITGHPRFDSIFTDRYISKRELQDQFGLNPTKKWILIATQPADKQWIPLIRHLAVNLSAEIIIKPHSNEVSQNLLGKYQEITNLYSNVKLAATKTGLYDLIRHADIVAVSHSTVGLEAMLFEKPVVFLCRNDNHYYNSKMLGTLVQTDPHALAGIIKGLLEDMERIREAEMRRRKFLAFAYPKRLSGKELTNLIRKLTNTEGNGTQG